MNVQGFLNFILIGDSTVGKTCFLTRYFKNQFTETLLSTIGIDKEMKHVKVANDNYKLTVWRYSRSRNIHLFFQKNIYSMSHLKNIY